LKEESRIFYKTVISNLFRIVGLLPKPRPSVSQYFSPTGPGRFDKKPFQWSSFRHQN